MTTNEAFLWLHRNNWEVRLRVAVPPDVNAGCFILRLMGPIDGVEHGVERSLDLMELLAYTARHRFEELICHEVERIIMALTLQGAPAKRALPKLVLRPGQHYFGGTVVASNSPANDKVVFKDCGSVDISHGLPQDEPTESSGDFFRRVMGQ